MSELLTSSRPSGEFDPARLSQEELLEQALTLPGRMGDTYSRFTQYSMNNQIWLFMQGVTTPVAGYHKWQDLGRQVKKGARAKWIQHPIIKKVENDKGEWERKFVGSTPKRSVFELTDTDGEELPPWEPPEWSRERALGALGIRETAFNYWDGNAQGVSRDNEVAINPVAVYPFKTLWHELGHVVLKHTTPDGLEEYQSHRGVMEFQAEATAYLGMNELGAADQMNAAESRNYIQTWLRGQTPDDKAIRQVFTATDRILKAGRSVEVTSND